jgi:hypothetical protein
MNIVPNTDPNGQTPPGSTPGQTPTVPLGQTPNGQPQQKTTLDNLPPDIQDYIKDLRKEAETSRKELDAKAKADQAAEQQRLKEQGQWQGLAEQATARVKELEPVQEDYKALSALLADQIKAQTKDWPKEVKDLLPGDDTPIKVRYEQVQKLQTLATQLASQSQQQQRASLPGNKPGPQPNQNNEQTREQQVNDFRLRRKQGGMYGL